MTQKNDDFELIVDVWDAWNIIASILGHLYLLAPDNTYEIRKIFHHKEPKLSDIISYLKILEKEDYNTLAEDPSFTDKLKKTLLETCPEINVIGNQFLRVNSNRVYDRLTGIPNYWKLGIIDGLIIGKSFDEAFSEYYQGNIDLKEKPIKAKITQISEDNLFQLEKLGNLNDFNTIGNFEQIAKDYGYISSEEYKNSLKQHYPLDREIRFEEWINNLDEYHRIFYGIHTIFNNIEIYKRVLTSTLSYIFKALIDLHNQLPDSGVAIEDYFLVNLVYYKGYNNIKYTNLIEYVNDQEIKKDVNAEITIFDLNQEEVNLFYVANLFYFDFKENNNRIFQYTDFQDFLKAGFFSWGTSPQSTFMDLNISSKILGYHYNYFITENGSFTPSFDLTLLQHYELTLSHEYFHHSTMHWKDEIEIEDTNEALEQARIITEIITEFRKFIFFSDNYNKFSILEDLYTLDEILRVPMSPYVLMHPIYHKGTVFLLSLLDPASNREQSAKFIRFCESPELNERFSAFYSLLQYRFNSPAIIRIKNNVNLTEVIEKYRRFINMREVDRFEGLDEFLREYFRDQFNNDYFYSARKFLSYGLIFINLAFRFFINRDYKDEIFENILNNMDNYINSMHFYNFDNILRIQKAESKMVKDQNKEKHFFPSSEITDERKKETKAILERIRQEEKDKKPIKVKQGPFYVYYDQKEPVPLDEFKEWLIDDNKRVLKSGVDRAEIEKRTRIYLKVGGFENIDVLIKEIVDASYK